MKVFSIESTQWRDQPGILNISFPFHLVGLSRLSLERRVSPMPLLFASSVIVKVHAVSSPQFPFRNGLWGRENPFFVLFARRSGDAGWILLPASLTLFALLLLGRHMVIKVAPRTCTYDGLSFLSVDLSPKKTKLEIDETLKIESGNGIFVAWISQTASLKCWTRSDFRYCACGMWTR